MQGGKGDWRLFVFGDVFTRQVPKRNAGHTIIRTFDHERVRSAEHIAHHGSNVVQTGNRLVIGIAHLHVDVRVQAAQYGKESERIAHLRKERPFLDGVQVLGVFVEVGIFASIAQLVVAIDGLDGLRGRPIASTSSSIVSAMT